MSLTRHARALAAVRQEQRELAQREEYRGKLLRLQQAFEPPLSSVELSAGLGLEAPRHGEAGVSEVARFLSESPRFRKKRPDGATRALIDCLLEGELFIAARAPMPGVRRDVLICEERDVALLAAGWTLKNLAGRPLPARRQAAGKEWEDSALWDLFGEGGAVPAAAVAATAIAVPAGAPLPWLAAAPALPEWLGQPAGRIGFGAMRLSTAGRPDEKSSVDLLVAALEAGVTFFDSADSYCLEESEAGHNEILIRRALETWGGDTTKVRVATKAGLRRPGGKWLPDGRPEHLRAACEASLRRLGGDAIDLFQLHTPDPKVPLLDSVGELGRLRAEGKILRVGLSNVTLAQLVAARGEVEIAAVQNAFSFFDNAALRSGLWQACRDHGTLLIAHSPLGGHRDVGGAAGGRAGRDPLLAEIAARRGITVFQLVLAWLLSWPGILPIPGATRRTSLEANLAIAGLMRGPLSDPEGVGGGEANLAIAGPMRGPLSDPEGVGGGNPLPFGSPPSPSAERGAGGRGPLLSEQELKVLDQRAVARSRGAQSLPPRATIPTPSAPVAVVLPAFVAEGPAGQPAGDELVLFVGPPAAGKTSRVAPFLEAGYERLNRDLIGGKLENLLPILRRKLQEGGRRFVLDNTYATREQRRPVLQLAREAGLATRILHLDVPVGEALYNACLRMLERHGKILDPEEVKRLSRRDPNLVPPAAIYRFFEVFEAPHPAEGFSRLERIPFARHFPSGYDRKALILDIDGTVRGARGGARFPRHPDEVELLPHRRETLLRWREQGYLLLAVSNQAHIGLGQVSEEIARACFDRLLELLGFPIEIHYCPHPPVPAGVWARKPMPGLGVLLIEKHRLDRAACTFVGDQEVDRQFAANAGFLFRTPEEIFGPVDGSAEKTPW